MESLEENRNKAILAALKKVNRVDDRHTEEGIELGWDACQKEMEGKLAMQTLEIKEVYEELDTKQETIEELEAKVEKMKGAFYELISIVHDYAITQESVAIAMAVEQVKYTFAKSEDKDA
jgi:hypothetical protein